MRGSARTSSFAAVVRVLHFSDVHVGVPLHLVPLRDLLGKRALGAANLVLRRHRLFVDAPRKLASLARFADDVGVDVAVCTGDYTALGTRQELRAARDAIAPLTKRPLGFVTVPGNHDLYVPDTVTEHRFEDAFGDLVQSDLPELAVRGPFPTVKLVGDALAIVGVTSARPNPELFRSSGAIGREQLEALRRVLRDPRVRARFVIVATHYAPLRADGTKDTKTHGLDDADALLALLKDELPRGMLVHGHIHHRYFQRVPGGSGWIFNSGSATHKGREGAWLYALEGQGGRAIPVDWDGARYALNEGGSVAL